MPMNTQHTRFAAETPFELQYKERLEAVKNNLNWLIIATHSGEVRNQFTNANIHIGLAESVIEQEALMKMKGEQK